MEEKVSLPIKTKIAAWWMIVAGVIELLRGCFGSLLAHGGEAYGAVSLPLITGIFIGGLLIIFGFFLLANKKRSWGLAVTYLFLLLISTVTLSVLYPLLLYASGYSPPLPLPLPSALLNIIIGLGWLFAILSDFEVLFHFLLFLIPLILLHESLLIGKISPPIKTKIGAWWIGGMGVLIMLLGMLEMGDVKFFEETLDILSPFLIFLLGSFIYSLSFYVRKMKKWAWWMSLCVGFILILSWLRLLFGPPSPLSAEPTIY
jgi:hypothetical protein